MSWLFSRALVAASLEDCSWGGELSAPLNATPTPQAYSSHDRTTEPSRLSRYGMTCEPLTDVGGTALLMWFRAVSLVRTSASPGRARASTGRGLDSGGTWRASLAKYDPNSSTWRTAQSSLLGGLDESSVTWPRSGSMRNGTLYQRATLARITPESESGLLPTPTATDHKSESMSPELVMRRAMESKRGVRLTERLHRMMLPTPTAGNDHSGGRMDEWGGSTNPFRGTELGRLPLNPCWVEERMGWPIGWTDSKPLATDKFHEWQQQHSPRSPASLSEAA
jgi:hypothetical protein